VDAWTLTILIERKSGRRITGGFVRLGKRKKPVRIAPEGALLERRRAGATCSAFSPGAVDERHSPSTAPLP
jgi:hypothetical protein